MSALVEKPTEAMQARDAGPLRAPARSLKRRSLRWIIVAAGVVALVFLRLHHTADAAMSPTLSAGDVLLVNRWTYRGRLPFRGEIVLVRQAGEIGVRRIIGIGGDTVEMRSGRVCIGGVDVVEPYRPLGPAPVATGRGGPWLVPGGMVLVMHDRDDETSVGRSPAVVPLSDVEGRVESVIFPPAHRGRH